MHAIGFKIHTLHSWMGDAAEPSWAVVGCLLHSIHIFQKMNRRPRLGRAQLGYDPVKIKMSPRFHIFTPVDEDYSIQKKIDAGGHEWHVLRVFVRSHSNCIDDGALRYGNFALVNDYKI